MTLLILGLIAFLGAHSVRLFADDWRTTQLARLGEKRWKGLYSAVSLIGLVLIVWGFGLARADSAQLWSPPAWMRYVAALLVGLSFVLVTAAYVPGNGIKAAFLGHPMILGVKAWAVGHLLANGRVVDVVLFGAFLIWAVASFSAARRRDRAAGTTYPKGTLGRTVLTIVIGLVVWLVFARYLHLWLIGVPPFAS